MRALLILVCALPMFAQAPASTTHQTTPRKPAAKPATPPPPPAPMTEDEKTIYAIGLQISQSLSRLNLSPAEVEIVRRALADNAAGKPAVQLSEYQAKIPAFAQARSAQAADKQKTESAAYIDKAAAQPGAEKTPSGLVYRELTPGTGASPKASDTVKVNYRGTLVDGTEFDSSAAHNGPASFPLGGVIPCWTEGLQKMKVGGKAQLVCPSSLAYGDNGRPGIPGGAALIFEIELLDVSSITTP